MRAVVIHNPGARGELRLEEVPDPVPGPRDVLVRVRAAALNRADLSARAGTYAQQATRREGPPVAGLEAAGEVVSAGPQARRFAPGDRVMGQCSGGFAQLLAVDERLLLPIPRSIDWTDAAATPVALVTGHDAIGTNARLRIGESVLVQGAGSAVGMMAVQIARLLGAGLVLGTVGDPARAELLIELGADLAIDYRREGNVGAVVARKTEGRGIDVVIDHVGGSVLGANLDALAVAGRLVSVGRLESKVGKLDMDLLARKRVQLLGVSFRTRTIDEYGDCVSEAAEALLPSLAAARLRPIVDRVFPLEQAPAALERMSRNLHRGKIVLRVQ